MSLVGLEVSVHYRAASEKVGQPGHVRRIEHVNLQEVFPADMKSEKGYAFTNSHASNIYAFRIVCIAAKYLAESMIDTAMKAHNIRVD